VLQVSENLRKQEKKGDMERQVQIDAINKVRLAKADKMLDKLTKDNSLINEMVHHTVKVREEATTNTSPRTHPREDRVPCQAREREGGKNRGRVGGRKRDREGERGKE